ncbi:hypothetical protein BU15DRAFT_65966 [Melanogaster broomeanus]|nr:hypothetical protein BU15DRAFT_65966 [Melanogaster broomeanus]
MEVASGGCAPPGAGVRKEIIRDGDGDGGSATGMGGDARKNQAWMETRNDCGDAGMRTGMVAVQRGWWLCGDGDGDGGGATGMVAMRGWTGMPTLGVQKRQMQGRGWGWFPQWKRGNIWVGFSDSLSQL